MKTKITTLLGIESPVVQGGMAWVAESHLAAAVSNAGGLGIIGAASAPAEWVRAQIQEVKRRTDKPFGVNIMLMSPYAKEVAELVAEEKVPVVTTGAGSPEKYMSLWKEAGIKVIPVVASVALAKRMERCGADALVADGVDAVFTPTDNTIMTAELSIYEKFIDAGIPQYTGADSFALNGAFVGYGVDYANLGQKTADMIADILMNDADPATTSVETFDNGADIYVRTKFTEGKPYEFELTTYTTEESDELNRFILTATMGNKARLRTLHLADGKTKEAGQLWPSYKDSNFTEHNHTPVAEMIKDKNGGVWFIASPDEKDPTKAVYAEDTHTHWKYTGKKATQYWYCSNPSNELEGVVNGRYTYWASKSPIPGGIAYENFELTEPFQSGQSYIFGITPLSPEELINHIMK